MLIECHHCGAPLDVEGKERQTKCKYCGTVSRVKSLKTVAAETPSDWRPPQQWTPPGNFAADSAKTLAYHATWAVRHVLRTVIMLALFGALVPVVILLVTRTSTEHATTSSPGIVQALAQAQTAITQAKGQLEAAGRMAKVAAGQDLLEESGSGKIESAFRQSFGSGKIRALRLVVHGGHASLVAQDPKKPQNFDSYAMRGGVVSPPEPERLSGLTKRDPEKYLFDFDEVPFDEFASLGKQTVTELGYEGGKVSHIIVERNLPFSPNVVVRVYVSGPRDSGRIDYLTSGKVQKVYR